MDAWEYTTICASASSVYSSAGEYEKVTTAAAKDWRAQLNARGAEGWELVSERFVSDSPTRGPWAEYAGTMKRRIPPPG